MIVFVWGGNKDAQHSSDINSNISGRKDHESVLCVPRIVFVENTCFIKSNVPILLCYYLASENPNLVGYYQGEDRTIQ